MVITLVFIPSTPPVFLPVPTDGATLSAGIPTKKGYSADRVGSSLVNVLKLQQFLPSNQHTCPESDTAQPFNGHKLAPEAKQKILFLEVSPSSLQV